MCEAHYNTFNCLIKYINIPICIEIVIYYCVWPVPTKSTIILAIQYSIVPL